MADLAEKMDPIARSLLGPGEQLRGACVATQQSMFKGRMVVLAVTDRRLIVQGVNGRWEAAGEPISLPPERIAGAKAEGAGEDWVNLASVVLDRVAVTLKLRTTDGEKLKLTMMHGEGMLGGLGGGEAQRAGVQALGAFFAAKG